MGRDGAGVESLYPFLYSGGSNLEDVLDQVRRSTVDKAAEIVELRRLTVHRDAARLADCARAMARSFTGGGRLFAFGNGGSATDADGVAQLYTQPVTGVPVAARSLVEDHAVLTALSNDIGFDVVFSRQLIAHGRPTDIAMGFSTSGNSENLLVAFAEARKQGMLTVGLSGYDGGRMAADPNLEHCLVVRSDSVHRIQEAQASLTHVLWAYVQEALAASPLPA